MASFCTKCGSPLTGVFCVKCGADARQLASSTPQPPAQSVQAVQPQQPPVSISSTPSASPVPKKSGPWVKIIVGVMAVGLVGCALAIGGVYYAYHRVKQKVSEATGGMIGSDSDSSSSSDSSSKGESTIDACRLLSKEDVSKAIGVEIVRTERDKNSCSYIAKGSKADMVAKHTTAMIAARGADKKTQDMVQTVAGGFFKTFQNEDKSSQDNSGEVPVFNFSIDETAAEEQMRLNAKVLGGLGDSEGLPGIGDQAFVSADGMIMLRKGNKLVRIMYITCPCGTEAVKPLAKEIADAL
jgi:hypothetical protein